MNEKASPKDKSEEPIAKTGSDLPGIPEGEELALDPVGGEEIDPIDRWWDDSESEEREKGVNRRVEEGPPRRARPAVKGRPEVEEVEEVEVTVTAPVSPMQKGQKVPVEDWKESPQAGGKSIADFLDDTSDRSGDVEEPVKTEVSEVVESPGQANESKKVGDPQGAREVAGMEGLEKLDSLSEPSAKKEEGIDEFLAKVASGDSEVPLAKAESQRKKAGCWTMFTTIFFLGSLLLFAALAAAAFFVWTRIGNLEEEISVLVKNNLEKQGIFLEHGEWSYQFPRGLVFDEMTVFEDATLAGPVMKLTGAGISADLFGLLRDRSQLGTVEISLKDSDLTLFDTDGSVVEIKGIDGEILAGAESIEFERLSADLWGYRLQLKGRVDLPEGSEKAGVPEGEGAAKEKFVMPVNVAALRQLESWLAVESAEGGLPSLNVTFEMESGSSAPPTLEGSLNGQAVTWHGVDFTFVTAAFRVVPETGALSFPSFQFGYGEGLIAGRGGLDFAENRLTIETLQSSVDVIALLTAYDVALGEKLKWIRFLDAPTVQVSGSVALDDPAQAELVVQYDHRQGLVYTGGERELPLRDIRGKFTYSRGSLETNDAAADLFGGNVSLNGATRLTAEDRPFNGLIEITRMPLERAAAWFGEESTGLSGHLTLNFRGVGYSDKAKIRGGGNLRIDDASLPSFPVLGPVQALVGRIVPAFQMQGAGSVKGGYIIESGVLLTSDLTIENGGAKIVTTGNLKLETRETAFTSKAMLEPSLAAATGLADKAITVEGSGPVTDPKLKVVEFPIEFAAESLGAVLGTSPESLASLKDILNEEDNPVDVISGKIEEATGITIDPAINDLFKSLLGGGAENEESRAPATETPATVAPVIATPVTGN